MTNLCLYEYGYLLRGERTDNSLRACGVVHPDAWKFLEKLAWSNVPQHAFLRTTTYHGQQALQITNYVGVITTPDGTQIEILPKTSEDGQDTAQTRSLLWTMLQTVDALPFLETTDAELMLADHRLVEMLITRFLQYLSQVVRRGIRKDYSRFAAEEYFLKGQLQFGLQLRQPIGKQHLFCIEYDIFSENRAENRLVHAALLQVARWSKSNSNQLLCRKLRFTFDEVPVATDLDSDFSQWRSSRDMIHYRSLLPWLQLILNRQCPFSLLGKHVGISFLFPMETLFEKYVAKSLERNLPPGYSLKSQVADKFLSTSPQSFMLKPDLVLYENESPVCVLDTKWKLIDADTLYNDGNPDPKAGILQVDVYQMYAYGKKYLTGGVGRVVLIYPAWRKFDKPLPPFVLDDDLRLAAIPFPLKEPEKIITLLMAPVMDSSVQ